MSGIEEALIFDNSDQLPNFGPPFMAHAPASSAPTLAPLTRTHDVGAVLTTCDEATAKEAIRRIRRANPAAAILLDASRYSGKSRGIGASCITADWINMQVRVGLRWALTDSGYIPAGDLTALHAVLAWGAELTQVVTALPLAIRWLTVDRDALIAELTAAGKPVALMLESEGDPLATKEAVTGLIAILRCPVPVLMLRSDTSVLGALAHGAAAVSVGTKSGLRHIYPITDDDDAFIPPPSPSAYVPALKSYKRLTTIEDGITRNPNLDVWKCNCSVCQGRSLAWIVFHPDPETAAFEHSLAAQSDVAKTILAHPPGTRGSEWKTMCAVAQVNHDQIVKKNGKTWEPADALSAWVSSTPHPQASTP
ncbi:hypothetical protein [Nocardia terpenica]|uniref:Uncharacterized protein n=1 Tax=Nocardia terpenica TaxID=455432 RepID=A0A6G9ZE52_9NOCA|nr:hypothetical protein [Nocardia terpenica]QIS23818.1 hypothetical protein F6W96_41565 [Nocardia terpenica]